MGRKWVYIVIAAVLVVILAVGGIVFYTSTNNYAAKVNGQKITKAEYQFFVNLAKAQFTKMGYSDMNQKAQNKTVGELVKEGALDSAVEYKIQLIKAKESNIQLTKEEEKSFSDYFDNTVVKQYGATKLDADKNIKAETGVTLEQFKDIYRNYQLTEKFRYTEAGKIKVSDEDIKKYFADNMRNAEKETVWHILIKTVDDAQKELPEDKVKEAEKKANEVLDKVKAGGNFAELAQQYSEDGGSKYEGGAYIGFPKGQMVPEFEKWAFESKEGMAGIVKTTYGFHVMKKPTFDEVKDKAKNGLLNKKYADLLEKWKKDNIFKPEKNESVIKSIKI
ncbi:MAG: peptidylprolyl isomerase [Clostridia bacterium]|nr:peptidylprolyl isomerase [Clostridia bacterium]